MSVLKIWSEAVWLEVFPQRCIMGNRVHSQIVLFKLFTFFIFLLFNHLKSKSRLTKMVQSSTTVLIPESEAVWRFSLTAVHSGTCSLIQKSLIWTFYLLGSEIKTEVQVEAPYWWGIDGISQFLQFLKVALRKTTLPMNLSTNSSLKSFNLQDLLSNLCKLKVDSSKYLIHKFSIWSCLIGASL